MNLDLRNLDLRIVHAGSHTTALQVSKTDELLGAELVIESVTEADGKVYTCTATSWAGSAYKDIELVVLGEHSFADRGDSAPYSWRTASLDGVINALLQCRRTSRPST